MREEGYYFFFYGRKYLMRYYFILLETFFSSVGDNLFFMTFLSDAGGHLDLGIDFDWPHNVNLHSFQDKVY